MKRGQQSQIGYCYYQWHWYLLIVITDLSFVHGDPYGKIISVPALGRVARLGELYNSVTDEFTQVSIMDKDIPVTFITRIQTPKTEGKHDIVSNAQEKSVFIGVSTDLSLSAKVGVFGATAGAGLGFLGGGTKKEKTVTGAFHFETQTDRDILEIFYDDMRTIISKEILKDSNDTHVVVGIGWGASVITQFEDQSSELQQQYGVKAKVRAGVNAMFSAGAIAQLFPGGAPKVPGLQENGFGFEAGAELAANASLSLNESFAGLSFSLFGDVFFSNSDYPQNITDVLKMVQRVPYMVNASNEGRGKQMHFFLMPIDRVRAFVNKTGAAKTSDPAECSCDSDVGTRTSYSTSSSSSWRINDGLVDKSMETLEQIEIVSNKLSDLSDYLDNNADIVNSTLIRALRQLRSEFKNVTDNFETKMRDGLILARTEIFSRNAQPRGQKLMEDLIKSYMDDPYGLYRMEDIIDHEYKTIKLKIKMVNMLRKNNVTWVGRGYRVGGVFIQDLENDDELMKSSACVLHFYTWYLEYSPLRFVKVALESKAKGRVYVADCDFPHYSCISMKSREFQCNTFFTPNTT